MSLTNQVRRLIGDVENRETITCAGAVPAQPVLHGQYALSVNVGMPGPKNLLYIENVLLLTIEDTRTVSEVYAQQIWVIKPKFKGEKSAK